MPEAQSGLLCGFPLCNRVHAVEQVMVCYTLRVVPVEAVARDKQGVDIVRA